MTPPAISAGFPTALLDGYRAFRAGGFARRRPLYRRLAEHGQAPETMVIACCDSRAAPETVFDAEPGALFVVRNVANLVPPHVPDGTPCAVAAALEFAVHGLKVRHILVLGHASCGGIRAALDPSAPPLSPGDFVGGWMRAVQPLAADIAGREELSDGERQTALERAAIRQSIANLRSFPWVSTLESRDRLHLHGAWFDIAEGELWVMDPATGAFPSPA